MITNTNDPKWVSIVNDANKTSGLAVIEARCRLKAEASRWAATRQRMLANGASFYRDIEPHDRSIIARATALPNCFLWMNHGSVPPPQHLMVYDDLAACFDALAEAVALVRKHYDSVAAHYGLRRSVLQLAADAQAALRIATAAINDRMDNDQRQVFHWVRDASSNAQGFILRGMRLTDCPEPLTSAEVARRIISLQAQIESVQLSTEHGELYSTAAIASDGKATKIFEPYINAGQVKKMPAERRGCPKEGAPSCPATCKRRARCQPATLVSEATSTSHEAQKSRHFDQTVSEVASLLDRQSVVLIGGKHRNQAAKAIKEAFNLSELYWIETRKHEAVSRFESHVARLDVAVVLLAIRWASHSFRDVQEFCHCYGKPLVRLPGGYSPNQIALQIMQQGSKQLRQRLSSITL